MYFVYSWSSFVAISSTGQPTDEGRPKNELKSWSNVGGKKFFLPTPNDFNKLAKIKTIPIVSCTRHSYLASQNGNMRCTTYKIDKKKETQAELHMHKKNVEQYYIQYAYVCTAQNVDIIVSILRHNIQNIHSVHIHTHKHFMEYRNINIIFMLCIHEK